MKLSDLAKMSEEERDNALSDMIKGAMKPPTIESIKRLEFEIKEEFEDKFNMSSEEMIEKVFKTAQIHETSDHCRWSILYSQLIKLKESFKKNNEKLLDES